MYIYLCEHKHINKGGVCGLRHDFEAYVDLGVCGLWKDFKRRMWTLWEGVCILGEGVCPLLGKFEAYVDLGVCGLLKSRYIHCF